MQAPFDEHELISQVLSGDQHAFSKLIRQYEGLVLHIVTPIIGANADREDLCQDIFIKVYEKLHTFRHHAKLGTWIGQIAYHMSLNLAKKKKHILMSGLTATAEAQLEQIAGDMDSAETILVREDQLQELTQCINQLNPAQQTALLLFYHEEQSLEEIRQIMNLPVNTIKSHLFRAKANLKKLLYQHEHQHGTETL